MILKMLLMSFVSSLKCDSDVSVLGVPPSKLLLYQPNKDFTCFDGSLTIPFTSVNDDFCDCADGSDEPGTSACSSSIFYCPNVGYYPLNIPSSRVNDGICDCCDGTDEYLLNNCTNTCETLGAQALAEAERIAELLNRGNTLRLQMSGAGKQMRQQKQERLMQLNKELVEAEKVKGEAEEMKNAAESRENAALEVYRELEEKNKAATAEKERQAKEVEARDLFRALDTNDDGTLNADEILVKIKSFKSSESKTDDLLQEEVKFIMHSKSDFKFEEFFDGAFDHLKSLIAADSIPVTSDEEQGEIPSTSDDDSNKQEDDHHEEEDDDDDGAVNEETGGGAEDMEVEDKDREDEGEQHGPLPADIQSEYDEDTARLIDEASKARHHFEEVERNYKDIERDISSLKEFLDKDYGPEDEFLSLEGQCFSYSDREYTYKLCPFDQMVQSGKHGGSETRLGTWKNWETPGRYDTMVYDHGQSCWNGPQRSAKVLISCGLDNELFSAAEPNKCEYVFEYRTPAGCRPMSRNTKDNIIRDEL